MDAIFEMLLCHYGQKNMFELWKDEQTNFCKPITHRFLGGNRKQTEIVIVTAVVWRMTDNKEVAKLWVMILKSTLMTC